MQLSRNALFYSIILLIAIIIVGSVGSEFSKSKENMTEKTELVVKCQMWNCEEPIPQKLYEKCQSIVGCIDYCKSIGAEMYCDVV